MEVEQRQFDRPVDAVATVAPAGATVCEVTIQVRNVNGAPRGGGWHTLFLSDSPVGAGLTAVTASGGVNFKPGGFGTDIAIVVAKKALLIQPQPIGQVGIYVLSITDAAKTPFRVCVNIGGVTRVVATLTTASYG